MNIKRILATLLSLLVTMLLIAGCSDDSDEETPLPLPLPLESRDPSKIVTDTNFISTSSIAIGWGTLFGADGYHIYRSDNVVGPFVKVGSSIGAMFSDSGLEHGTIYHYRVAAYNNGGVGTQSEIFSLITRSLPPTRVTAVFNSANSITVNWIASRGAAGYRIHRSTDISGPFEPVGVSADTLFRNTGLDDNTTYHYRVFAINSGGSSEHSSTATVLLNAPRATTTVNSSSSITVSWSAITGASGYRIYRGTSVDGDFQRIGTLDSTSFRDTRLTGNTTYYYRVFATNKGGISNQSNTASATTQMVPPTEVTATVVSSSSISVSWAAVLDATEYNIYRSASATGTFTRIGTLETTLFTDSGLNGGTTYHYRVSATNSSGTAGERSAAVSTTTLFNAPTGVTATTNSASSITVNWTAITGAAEYNIYRSISVEGDFEQIGTSRTASFTDSELNGNTAYYYRVSAVNREGASGEQSTIISATTLLNTPAGLTARGTSPNSIAIAWSAVTGATEYNIYRSNSATGTFAQVGTSTTTSFTDSGLTGETRYHYRVSAVNSAGESEQSSTVAAETL